MGWVVVGWLECSWDGWLEGSWGGWVCGGVGGGFRVHGWSVGCDGQVGMGMTGEWA